MKEIILLIVGAIFANNCVLSGYFGITSVVCNKKASIAPIGLGVVVSMLITSAVCGICGSFLAKYNLTNVCALVVSVLAALLFNVVAKEVSPKYAESADKYLPLIAVNSSVFGVALASSALDLGTGVLYALAAGIGFVVVSYIFAFIREGVNDKKLPKAFQGVAIDFVIAAIMALAFAAFAF